jgi:hypothetical protein
VLGARPSIQFPRPSRQDLDTELNINPSAQKHRNEMLHKEITTMKVRLLLCCFLLAVATSSVAAQRILGELTGTVTDPNGGAVVGAVVTASDPATGRSWTAQTNEDGVYRMVSLPTGTKYDVKVEQQGFKTTREAGVPLDVGEGKRLNFSLEVGEVSESVTISSEGTTLNLERGEVSAVVSERKIVELPLNGRNVYQLAELQPGIVRTAGTGLQESETTDAQVGASGTRFRDNQILLDGVTNNNDRQGGRTTLSLSPDAVEQFRVVTNNLSAEFGRSGGGLISVVTRGGTNTFHGSAFEFLRNDNLDAATTFEARNNSQGEFKRNHFGGTLGGPILKNKTFFFFSFQGLRQIRPALVNFLVETPQFRNFVIQTRPNSIAASLLRDFPPLLNPTTNIRDIGSPAPGVLMFGPPDGIPDVGEVFIQVPGFTFDNQYSIRLDHTFNEGNDTLTGRYSLNSRREQRPGDNSARLFTVDFLEKDQNASLSHTHIFSPQTTNELRLGYNYDPQINPSDFPEVPHVQFNAGLAGRSVSQFSQTSGFVFPLDFRLHTYQLYDALSLTRGNHGLKVGGEIRRFQENSDFPTFLKPLVTFQDISDFADDEVLTIVARVDPQTGQSTGTYRHFRTTEFGLFIQDDWKVTRQLTLNLGLRYDNFGTLKERDDKLSTLVFGSGSLADARIVQVNELYGKDNNNFAPRFGFAWDPKGDGKWAVRGGAGLFYSRIWTNFSGNSRFNPPFSLAVTLDARTPGQNPRSVYGFGFTGSPAFARPLDARGGSTALRPSAQTIDQNLRAPYVTEWFLGVQRELWANWMVEANYLGSAGRKLLLRQEINRFSGDLSDGAFNRVNQSFASIVHGFNAVSSIYQGLATQLMKRFAEGYTVQFAYTFSRSIDTDSEPFGGGAGELQGTLDVGNIALDRGLSAFDATHRFAGNFLYEVPLFRNRTDIAGSLLGGWQIGGILSLQSGFPFTVTTSQDYNQDGVASDRPNIVVSTSGIVGHNPHDFLNGVFGDPAQLGALFRPAPTGTNGNLGRNTFRGPGYATFDLSLLKSFRLPWFSSEGSRIEFRSEFFNLFNRVNLRAPSNSLGTFSTATGLWSNRANFGRSTSSFDARQIQFGLKFIF